MARARAIETRLEKLVPALDEYYSTGFLTREETVEVSRQRTHWEYRLVAKPLLLLDVRGAITYELGLEKRLRDYCIHTKLHLQHRWDIVERIEGIYKIGMKHLKNKKEHEALRQEFVLFLKQFQRNGSLSNLYGEMMITHPRRSDIWVEAAEWQATSQRNTDNARAILQQALLTMASEPAVWACALRVELQFVQRLLDGLLVEHQEEVRKARKKAGKAAENAGDHNGEQDHDADAEENAFAGEPTSVIGPKLRAENASMGHVLLDLALAKAVVEEALDSPASGAALVEQLLSTTGAFPFSKEVMELIVSRATHKMLVMCFASDDDSTTKRTGATAAVPSIVSHQQQLRVMAQWSHRHSIDTILAAYLSLEDALVNKHATAIVDTATYLSEGGHEAVVRQHMQSSPKRQGMNGREAYAEFSFANPSPTERTRAAVKALVSLVTFASIPTSTLAALPSVLAATAEDASSSSTQRFPVVRQALTEVLRQLAATTPGGVSQVCAALLQGTVSIAGRPESTAATKRNSKKNKTQTEAAPGAAELAQWILGKTAQLDAATQQACVAEPQERTQHLVEDIAAASAAAPPPKSRVRHEALSQSAQESPLLTWSVLQLERFLQPSDRGVLRRSAAAATATTTTKKAAAASSPVSVTVMTAEDVERFIVWWKEEEAALHDQEEQQRDDDDGSVSRPKAGVVAASRARRCAAVVELLRQHGLLPLDLADVPTPGANKKVTANMDAAAAAAWATLEVALLSRATALQFSQTNAPLSLWRVFNALEVMLGPAKSPAAPATANEAVSAHGSSSSDSSSSDGDEDTAAAPAAARGAASLGSFAAAGLFFLGGVSSSTLSREQEWLRLEGVTSLLRCRLVSWLGRRVRTRDTIVAALRASTKAEAESWIADVQALLSLAQRCHPLPRHAHTHCILPFLEAVAVYYTAGAITPSAAGRAAIQAARDAHETLLKLYSVSKHPESFLPLTYDGTSARKLLTAATDAAGAALSPSHVGKASTAAVQYANTEDWVAYVVFERAVARDLLRAKAVVEQARRAALSPQQFIVKLNSL